jgi:hypothetical protein
MTLRGHDGDAVAVGEATPAVTNKCGTIEYGPKTAAYVDDPELAVEQL